MNVYDWGFFFETGDRTSLALPFGPEHPNNVVFGWDDPWMLRAAELFPTMREVAEDMGLPLAMVVVNPPREATPAEAEYYKDYKESA